MKIPAGISDRQAVRIAGEGEPPPPEASPTGQGIRGDLHVVVRVRAHNRFEREGDHLLIAVPIAFSQAALGAEIEVPTLEAPTVLKVPAGTQHGGVFRLDGHGLPNLRSGKRGDLVVIVQLVVPSKLSEDQKRLLQEYAETEEIEVSPPSPSLWEKIKDAMSGS